MKSRALIYMISSVILPTILSFLLDFMKTWPTSNFEVNLLILCALCFLSLILFDIGFSIIKGFKSQSASNMLRSINSLGNKYKINRHEGMYTVLEEDIKNSIEAEKKSNWPKQIWNKITHSKHNVFFSMAANYSISWIEFVNLLFLKHIRDELGCQVIIFVQLNDSCRESGLFSKPDQILFEEQVKKTKKFIGNIFGTDVLVLVEDQFHSMHSNVYTHQFHEIFVGSLIDFASRVETKKETYAQFLRRLSYLESTYPIMALQKEKSYVGRTYILDRAYAYQTWHHPMLYSFSTQFDLKFIRIKTLTDSNGQQISFSKSDDVLNISDCYKELKRKLQRMDICLQNNILNLLSSVLCQTGSERLISDPPEDTIDQLLLIISKLQGKYSIAA